MKTDSQKVRTKKGMKKYTYLGCPLTRNRSAWCYRLCTPDGEGNGRCGRVAPHSFKSRTQIAIEKHNRKLLEAHFEKLEKMYLKAPCNEYYEPGIHISEGAAEIVIPVRKEFHHAAGSPHGAVCYKAMEDAAFFAASSAVDDVLIKTVSFGIQFTGSIDVSELVAKARLVGIDGSHFLAEAVLTNAQGKEIARGNGTYMRGTTELTSDIGYDQARPGIMRIT